MANKGKSLPGLFGTINHYDEHGKKIGHSDPGLFGGYNNYDANGRKTGHSSPGLFGGYTHYDNHGRKVGSSDPGIFGSHHHRDANGKSTGSSDPGMFGGYNHSSSGGCYVATCVYGSYDCPEVWTLRRFRDNTLASNVLGRSFIKTYYAISPTVVQYFGKTRIFQKFWRGKLDAFVKKLNDQGISSKPYADKNW